MIKPIDQPYTVPITISDSLATN